MPELMEHHSRASPERPVGNWAKRMRSLIGPVHCETLPRKPKSTFGVTDLRSRRSAKSLILLATPAGLEPATSNLEGWSSIQLSYGVDRGRPA
jgi:hypothetical protein